ncbi:MAG: F0F1 ATP synthase subunit B' [Alphaproteobacteria bacterium]
MPQFDPAVFSPQLVWLAITFVMLYVLMARGALPRIGEVLEARRDKIAHDIDAATTLRSEAEAVLAEYEVAMVRARSEAQSLLAEAAEKRAAEAEARIAEIDARTAAQLAEAEARIAAARDAALVNIETIAGEIARSAAEKLVGVTVDDGALKAALAAAGETR